MWGDFFNVFFFFSPKFAAFVRSGSILFGTGPGGVVEGGGGAPPASRRLAARASGGGDDLIPQHQKINVKNRLCNFGAACPFFLFSFFFLNMQHIYCRNGIFPHPSRGEGIKHRRQRAHYQAILESTLWQSGGGVAALIGGVFFN